MDGDGDLDAFVANQDGDLNGFFRNDAGKFTDVAKQMGMDGVGRPLIYGGVGPSVIDFDNDGDLDLYLGQNVGPQWIYENSDGKGTFVEHRIAADSRGHEARVGDVDCDGDLDIIGKPWGQQNEGGEQAMPPRDHVYLQNMLVERGGTARFDAQRGIYELQPAAKLRVCTPR